MLEVSEAKKREFFGIACLRFPLLGQMAFQKASTKVGIYIAVRCPVVGPSRVHRVSQRDFVEHSPSS
jgi:hypothetical protein